MCNKCDKCYPEYEMSWEERLENIKKFAYVPKESDTIKKVPFAKYLYKGKLYDTYDEALKAKNQ